MTNNEAIATLLPLIKDYPKAVRALETLAQESELTVDFTSIEYRTKWSATIMFVIGAAMIGFGLGWILM